MTEKDVIREAMNARGWSQAKLAEEAGFKGQTNVSGLLNNNKNGIRVDKLYRVLNAMGYEIVIRDKMGSGKEYKITI